MARPHHTRQGLVLAVVVALSPVVQALVALPEAAECPATPLLNSGFEDGPSERGAGEVSVANGWHPFWQQAPFQEDGRNLRPEYKPEDASRYGRRRVLSGNVAPRWFNPYGAHNAGIDQRVNVPQESAVTFGAWWQGWSPYDSSPDLTQGGWYVLYVGIAPTGATDWASPYVVWSEPSRVLNRWAQMTVQARAQGDADTVDIRDYAEFRNKHTDAYVDDAGLTYVAPTPRPTNTPRATNTPANTPTPSNTLTPTRTSMPEPLLTSEAMPVPEPAAIRVLAVEDTNGNDAHDAGEPLLSGVRVEVVDASEATIATLTTEPSATNTPRPTPTPAPGANLGSCSRILVAVAAIGGIVPMRVLRPRA